MGKRALWLLGVLCAVLLSGCGQGYADTAEAIRAGAVLGENIIIDNIPVSGMPVGEARRLLLAEREKALDASLYEIRAGEKHVRKSAAELGAYYDVDAVLGEALELKMHYPANNAPRRLESVLRRDEYILDKETEKIASALSEEPADAFAVYDKARGAFTYTAEADGQHVDAKTLKAHLRKAFEEGGSQTVSVPFETLAAAYTLSDAKADTVLVSSFSTSFAGNTYSKEGRVHNIEKAAALIDGATLMPGEEFDMNALLGPRTAEYGWKEAIGIRDAVYVEEYGGGVCQVSSTLYNAVLMADLTVTERTHHSWPLGYIAIGLDATISTGGPNFRFLNTAEVPVTVGASVDREKKTVTVSVYGRALKDGISIKVTSEKLETLPEPTVEYVVDDALSPGEQVVVREPRRGSVSATYKEYYSAEGSLLRRERVAKDKYRSISGITRIGPLLGTLTEPAA